MLDIKFLRSNPDVVKQNIKNKFQDEKLPLVDEVIELDKRNREIKQEVEALRAEKNKASKEIGAMMAQKKLEEAEALKKKVAESNGRINELSEEEKEELYDQIYGNTCGYCEVSMCCEDLGHSNFMDEIKNCGLIFRKDQKE